jgi:hypothetical protein
LGFCSRGKRLKTFIGKGVSVERANERGRLTSELVGLKKNKEKRISNRME